MIMMMMNNNEKKRYKQSFRKAISPFGHFTSFFPYFFREKNLLTEDCYNGNNLIIIINYKR